MTTTAITLETCPGCVDAANYARSLRSPGAWVRCDECGASVAVDQRGRDRAARATRTAPARNRELALLGDCAKIARYDAYHTARTQDPNAAGGTDRSGATEMPDALLDSHRAMARGAELRQRLVALRARGRADDRLLDLLWVFGCMLAYGEGRTDPEHPAPSRDAVAARVVAWAVPRAAVFLRGASESAQPADLRLVDEIARAFVSPGQWARWHPAPPPPLVEPDKRTEPEGPGEWAPLPPFEPPTLPPDPTNYQREAYARAKAGEKRERRLHERAESLWRVAQLFRVIHHALAVASFARRHATWPDDKVRHAAAEKRYREALEAGVSGKRRVGNALLATAVAAWFDAPAHNGSQKATGG